MKAQEASRLMKENERVLETSMTSIYRVIKTAAADKKDMVEIPIIEEMEDNLHLILRQLNKDGYLVQSGMEFGRLNIQWGFEYDNWGKRKGQLKVRGKR